MPYALAQYLRHLATRCSRMSRDCNDPVISKELVIISVELVEKAEAVEADYALPSSTADASGPAPDVVSGGDDDKS
jgi:hypothetical protein